jgi:glucose/arabinose dehydrogenase
VRALPALLVVLALAPALALALPAPPRADLPDVPAGFALTVLTPAAAPTSIDFGPDGNLYATDLAGELVRTDLAWTAAGPVVTGRDVVASGFSQPLGVAFADGAIFVSDSHADPATSRIDGYVARIDPDGSRHVVVDGLPNGRHNTNHLRLGPDGRLYVGEGNSNDHGCPGGDCAGDQPEVPPYGGAILSIDPTEVTASPAVLHWTDANGDLLPPASLANDTSNADFAQKVHVLAHGMRNVFGVAFRGAQAYTGMNGPDSPSGQDVFFAVQPGADYGFPYCYNVGTPGGVDNAMQPNPDFPGVGCSRVPHGDALLGWHVCATGLDVPNDGPFGFRGAWKDSAYQGECTQFFPETDHVADGTYDTAHKVARVALDPATGKPTGVTDFVDGLVLCTDVRFGPDGAMYVADAGAIYRVAEVV